MSLIRTKYLPATSTRSARIKATLANASHTQSYDWELSGAENHDCAANVLACKLNLKGKWGRIWDQSQKDGNTYVCLTDAHSQFTVA